jgi:hypothetical protein
VLRPTQDTARLTLDFAYGAITHYGQASQLVLLSIVNTILQSYNPGKQVLRFGLFPFRSPLLRESRLIYIPRGTKMFQFPLLALPTLYIQVGVTY